MRPIISDQEFQDRVQKTQQRMQETGIDLLLAYGNEVEPQFPRYYSDYWPSFESAGVLIAQEGDPVLLIGPESMTYAADRSRIREIRRLSCFRESSNPEYPGHVMDRFRDAARDLMNGKPLKRLAIAGYQLIPHFTYEEITQSLDDNGPYEVIQGDDLVVSLRMIKSPAEIECMRYAGNITARTFDHVIQNIRPGMTESQVRGLALGRMHQLGAENEAYPTWVLAGEGGNQAISRARQKAIGENEMVHLQFGARYEGYASTIGRPVIFGKPEEWMLDAIRAGYEGYEAVAAELYAGNNAGNVANAFYNTMKANGHLDWLLYGPCHGTGLMEGEPPWIEKNSDFTLKENMTFCICLFMGNRKGYGFRIEDSFRVGKDKPESLTDYPKEILLL
ncbi:MAG: Xaa-Pro peptidase family protein [Eubacteriales bacterium]|nr:Xaa-Pro peptidase family protein [Eubacteriales bacterium]